MEKLKMHTPDLAEEKYKKLVELFPNAVTETIDEDGNVVRAIDKDVLMQEINAKVVDDGQERYQFTWPDKRKSVVLANAPIAKTLRLDKEKSVGRDGTPGGTDSENIYIEGDNLDALKLLQETYLGKVKMIYIDPPYNTGNDFIYEDDFSQSAIDYANNSGQTDSEGNRLVQNNESNGRFHTDWLNMLYPRLKVAKDLLTDDGAIFISIDDNEHDNLKKICDEVFGTACFVADISWQKVYSPKNNNIGLSSEVEYIVCYSKQKNWVAGKLDRTEKMNSSYKNPDNDPMGKWTSSDASAPGASTHQGMVYAIQNPFTGEMLYPTRGCCWRKFQDDLLIIMNGWASYELRDLHDEKERANVCGISETDIRKGVKGIVLSDALDIAKKKAQNVMDNCTWPLFYFTGNGTGGIRKKTYLKDMEGKTATNLWNYTDVGHTDEAKKELAALFDGYAPFDTPKPVRLLKQILKIGTGKDSIVMDFFSGSGTLAQAVMESNVNEDYNRKFICVQLDEKSSYPNYATICDIGEDRIRRAGKKIKEETDADIDYGFRCFKVDSSNMKDVYYRPSEMVQMNMYEFIDNIKEDRTPEDLLLQVMLDLGVLLSSKIETKEIAGKKVFSVEDGYLLACFDENVTEETVKEIAKQRPFYAVFRDYSMVDDSVATNFEQIFETYSPQTIRKVL